MTAPDPTTPSPADWLIDQLRPYLSSAYLVSLIRTFVPVAVGSLLAYVGAHWHLTVSRSASSTAAIVATAVTVAAYYALARWVERRWPSVGRWLIALGMTDKTPAYTPPEVTARLRDASGSHRAR